MNILFVCTGNTCRSPMAQGYLKSKKLPHLEVRSRGFCEEEMPASQNTVACLEEMSIDIKTHLSKNISIADIAWADKIVCMSESHRTALSMYAKKEKLSVLNGGISDPYGGDLERYRECRNEIISAIDELTEKGFFNEIYISQIEKEHIKDIARLEKLCFSTPWSKEAILDAFMRGTKFFVALEGKKLLGYIGISCILDEGYITNIAVFPEHRNKGIGTRLLERTFSLASDLGLSFISLEVRASNQKAISLYENLGFKEEGKRKNFYTEPLEDALIMTKRFG